MPIGAHGQSDSSFGLTTAVDGGISCDVTVAHTESWLRPMNRPSEKALSLAEELSDYEHRGLTRADAINEMAEIIDETNRELVESAITLLDDAERHGGAPLPWHLARLKRALLGHEPLRTSPDTQTELFVETAAVAPPA